jgi:hypothetical protein
LLLNVKKVVFLIDAFKPTYLTQIQLLMINEKVVLSVKTYFNLKPIETTIIIKVDQTKCDNIDHFTGIPKKRKKVVSLGKHAEFVCEYGSDLYLYYDKISYILATKNMNLDVFQTFILGVYVYHLDTNQAYQMYKIFTQPQHYDDAFFTCVKNYKKTNEIIFVLPKSAAACGAVLPNTVMLALALALALLINKWT